MLSSIRILLVRFGREGYNWNQLILHASIYLRKQFLEILICKNDNDAGGILHA